MDEATRRHLHLGRELFARNDFEGARAHLEAALAGAAGQADVFNMLGVMAHHRGDYGDARAAFERALAINADYTEAALNLAITCNDLGLYGASRAVAETLSTRTRRGDRIEPFARGKLANLHAEVARAYDELGLFDEAADAYRQALRLAPTFTDLRVKLATVLRRDGDLEAALEAFEAALSITPDHVGARVKYGFTLHLAGRSAEARAAWESALAVDPADRAALAYLKMVEAGETRLPSMIPPAMRAAVPDASARDDDFEITLLKGADETP